MQGTERIDVMADRPGAGSCALLGRFPAYVPAALEDLHGVQVHHSPVVPAVEGDNANRDDPGRVTGAASDHRRHLLTT